MPFVPWRDLGICPFWADTKTRCNHKHNCRWLHPPWEEIQHLWDAYTVAEREGIGEHSFLHLAGRAPPPPDHVVAVTEGANDHLPCGTTRRVPSRSLPPHAPNIQMASVDFQHRGDLIASRPLLGQLSSGAFCLPSNPVEGRSKPSTRGGFEEPPAWHMEYPRTRCSPPFPPMMQSHYPRPTPPMPMMVGHCRVPEFEDRNHRRREYEFDPRRSHNPYVNGTEIYYFVWGNPLCVRCGTMGHLPKQCNNLELSKDEQDHLFTMINKGQKHKKPERGVDRCRPTVGAALTPEAVRSPPQMTREVSMLDVPPSPKAFRNEGLRSQADYWNKKQQKQRAFSRDDHDILSIVAEEAQKAVSRTGRKRASEGSKKPGVAAAKGQKAAGTAAKNPEPPPGTASSSNTIEALAPPTALAPAAQQQETADMVATKRLSNGEAKAVGPHPSTIRVSAPYITQSALEKRLQLSTTLDAQERSLAEAREDSVRLQGVTWLDTVRRALQLPVRTFTTACVYYHKFRLAHPTALDYNWSDAAAASLLTSCKNEDTLKKSRDILAAAYNLKQPATHELVGADDPIFEQSSRVVIGLERLVLESGGFDFRTRSPHQTLVKISKSLPKSNDLKSVSQLAWTILTDLHRTFAPLKQTSSTLALASLELAAHFKATTSPDNTCTVRDDLQALDLNKWSTSREEVMETLLDTLDLYTHHTVSTILGTKYSLDDFLRIRLAFNKECSESSLPRYTVVQPPPSPDNANGTSSTLRVTNGHPTPVSPPQPGTQAPSQSNGNGPHQPTPEGGGTLRFMLNPQRATEERTEVNRYYTEEWEEYEEEIEVPVPRNQSRDRDHDRDRTPGRPERGRYRDDDRRSIRDDRDLAPGRPSERNRERESLRDREREAERERAKLRDRDRERRYDDRRYDERERDRRYDDRRDRDRGDRDRDRDRRPYDDDRRRGRDIR